MYTPNPFKVTDRDECFAFIRGNPFGQLISTVEGRLFSSHLPFALNDEGTALICHLAKRNPQWEEIEAREVLVTFQGPHDYVSPTWYASPGVPTWNYQAVHVYGDATRITDAERLKGIVDELSVLHESGRERPWNPEYREELLEAIVGVEIAISEIQGKYKLSQNRPEGDQRRVEEALRMAGSHRLADAMKHDRSQTE